jgi:hypothetical protein
MTINDVPLGLLAAMSYKGYVIEVWQRIGTVRRRSRLSMSHDVSGVNLCNH